MSTANKTVDCSIHPTELRPNQDITGIGVSLAWTITAGLAFCLVVANYLVAYRPDIDPFGSHHPNPGRHAQFTFKSNPIDEQLLGWRLKKLRQVGHTSASTQEQGEAQARRDRIRDALTQCMLTMSDFQLITGLSVLISGYSQLPSGISIVHWERVIDLAWFSSITHLCCLTFLRDHFSRNWRARIWRIPGMVILVVLLSVALIPSSLYSVNSNLQFREGFNDDYSPSLDYAICFFKNSEEGRRLSYYHGRSRSIEIKKQNVIVSAVILIFGMTNRIWRLFETPTTFYLSAKGWLSRHIKTMLRWLLKETASRSAIFLYLVYRPALASYLLIRVLLDVTLSKAFEVWWLAVGLAWGLTNLLPISEPDDQEWTFGQVIASLMLVAPVLALIETLITTTHQSRPNPAVSPRDQTPDQPLLPSPSSTSSTRLSKSTLSREDPDFDFYNLSLAFIITEYAILLFIVAMILLLLVFKGTNDNIKPLETMWTIGGYPNILFLANATINIMCSLSIDQYTPKTRSSRVMVGICSFMLLGGSVIGGFVMSVVIGEFWGHYFIGFQFGVYLILLSIELMLTRRRSLKSAPLPAAHANGCALSLESVPATSTRESAQDQSTAAPFDGPSMNLPLIDTSSAFGPPRRQDTEAEIGVAFTRTNTI